MASKIGMCCYCGGSFPKRQTILLRDGTELCLRCAEMIGKDEEDDTEESDG